MMRDSLLARLGLTDLSHIDSSYELFEFLKSQDLLKNSPPHWWPSYGTFEVVIGAILTQNSQWSRVQVSLENLKNADLLELEKLSMCDQSTLETLIAPSGMFKNKAKYLLLLAKNILDEFGDFENFCESVDREWLLDQKGVGKESADSILCYACKREVMVVDSYSARLVKKCGYEFEEYDELQSWCEDGHICDQYDLYHGMIVEFVKKHKLKK